MASAIGLAQVLPPSAAYKRRVWFAVTALGVFMLLYFVLAGWFLYTTYRLVVAAEALTFSGILVGICGLFLAVFMLKPLFYVQRGTIKNEIEVTARDQPRLFAFLHELADSAEAPRPHRVYLSARVNAAVFYDLSLFNLLFPSKKNLEIGLPLVNGLSLGECRAVLAHEFGHFTQRSMAVLRWSQIAHQIAGHLVARRDKLDAALNELSRIDLRIAWIGWILSLIVWSIRSLVDSAFHGVVLLQRALSREMEMQADLIAVSLTGSDALIHALYRLQAADDSWERTLHFVDGQRSRNRIPRDVFTLHSHIMQRMAEILNNPAYGRVTPLPAERPGEHRLFRPELGRPPRMWQTHPLNHEREENAKRRYLSMPIDEVSAWTLFDDATGVREKVSALLLESPGKEPVTIEASLEALNAEFDRPFLSSRYRGMYLNRSIARSASSLDQLVGPAPADWRERLDRLYPETLMDDIARLRTLEQEIGQLRAIQAGVLQAPEGIVRHRGRNLRRKELPQAIELVEQEERVIEDRLRAEDRVCRGVHLAAATVLGGGWDVYLRGLLTALHYADHTAANLRDLYGLFTHVVRLVTVTHKVSSEGLQQALGAANTLRDALAQVYGESRAVKLDTSLLQGMEIESWAAYFEEFKLGPADAQNINVWLGVIDGWVNQALGACDALRDAALEQLLLTEAMLAEHVRSGTAPVEAPAASQLPPKYALLLPGAERKRPSDLSWWQRFQLADGVIPAITRFAVAAGIVGVVLGFGGGVGTSTIAIYNGLALPVVVTAAERRVDVGPESTLSLEVDAGETYTITARTPRGQVIDSFTAEVPGSFAKFVYNVASATPLVEWTAVYGHLLRPPPQRMLGAPRWSKSAADYLFVAPPESVSSSTGGSTRDVLAAMSEFAPQQQLGALELETEQRNIVRAHARWDATSSKNALTWFMIAQMRLPSPEYRSIVSQRVAEQPKDVLLLRMEQDAVTGADHDAVCARHRERAAAAADDADLAYLAGRCAATPDARRAAFSEGYRKWPKHPWLAQAVGYGYAEEGRWREAIAPLEQARSSLRPLGDALALDLARIRRLIDRGDSASVVRLARASHELQFLLNLESGVGFDSTPLFAYEALARGDVHDAVYRARADSGVQARVLRLAAASDGASPALARRALALRTDADLDVYSRWMTIALAVRSGRDYKHLLHAESGMAQEYTDRLTRFLELVRKGAPTTAAEQQLRDLPISLRGLAYSVGVVVMGKRAPAAWRHGAKRLLFVWERPYFS